MNKCNDNYLPTPCEGCLETFDGKCVNYTGTKTSYLGIKPNENFNSIINIIDNAFSNLSFDIEEWIPKSYKLKKIVLFGNKLWLSLNPTTSNDIPGSSTNWLSLTCCDTQPQFYTYTFEVIPSNATITINGNATNSFTGTTGTTFTVTVSATGYQTFTNTYTIGTANDNVVIELDPEAGTSFLYYWGEIGNIFAPNPSGISQTNWDNQIKPNGTSGNMNQYNTTFSNNYEKDSTGFNSQWWIVLVPTSETLVVNDLPNYIWYTWDVLTSAWYVFNEHSPYTGTVILDGINYTYSAIRPGNSNKIKYSKLP